MSEVRELGTPLTFFDYQGNGMEVRYIRAADGTIYLRVRMVNGSEWAHAALPLGHARHLASWLSEFKTTDPEVN